MLDALDAALEIQAVFVEAGRPVDAVADRARAAGVPVHTVRDGALARVTDTVTPQGVVAVASRPTPGLDLAGTDGDVLVLVGVGDPGNAGTLVRTAEAAGAEAVVFCEGSVDPFTPKCVRASAGSVFHVPVFSGGEPVEVLQRLGMDGRRRVATAARAGVAVDETDLTAPLAIVLGNEAHGLPVAVGSEVDEWVHIPMAGRVESLNVAVAGALVCFEAARQRRSREVRP